MSRHKRDEQSFSEVIKEHFGPQPTAGRFLARVRSIRLGTQTLDAAERLVSGPTRGTRARRQAMIHLESSLLS